MFTDRKAPIENYLRKYPISQNNLHREPEKNDNTKLCDILIVYRLVKSQKASKQVVVDSFGLSTEMGIT
jgi:hypothetical protein